MGTETSTDGTIREPGQMPGLTRPAADDPHLNIGHGTGADRIGEARHRPDRLPGGKTSYAPSFGPDMPGPFPATVPLTGDDLERQAGAEPPVTLSFDVHDAAALGVSLVLTASVKPGDESARVSGSRARLGPRRLEAMLRQAAKTWADGNPPEIVKLREHDAALDRLTKEVKRLEARQVTLTPEINAAIGRGDEARRKALQAERRSLAEDLDGIRPALAELRQGRAGLLGLCQYAQREAVKKAFARIKEEAAARHAAVLKAVGDLLTGRVMEFFVAESMAETARRMSATAQDWPSDYCTVK
jgi:hypothetical protein